jgi:hypothetical protein
MIWQLGHRYDKRGVLLADRHYSRQKPGTPQFMPSGRAFVLYAEANGGEAVWGTSWPEAEYTQHEWAGAWMCSIFRNEGAGRSSVLIRQAVAATRYHFGEPPALGMVTFVDPSKVRPKTDPGHTFIIAGFRPVGFTKRRGYLALQLLPSRMPKPEAPIGMQSSLF